MNKMGGIGAMGCAALAALSLVLTPALAAQLQGRAKARPAPSLRSGTFTPAIADPGLQAELARRGLQVSSFRFTPASTSSTKSKAVRVAVRARGNAPSVVRVAEASATPVTAITPSVYNLGVSVGWKRFALTGDVARVRGGPVPGGREAAQVEASYSGNRFTGRVEVAAARPDIAAPRIVGQDESYSLGVGGSFRLSRNLDLTGGVRYKIQRDRLEPLADQRRDSQAVYVGTAFRF
ncbi:MAG TPA: porin, partial [Allosphingosinicella sp.]